MNTVRRLVPARRRLQIFAALLLLPWLALLGWLTSVGWFITDDAFISFRYVRNLLEGHGLVFNPGEYVEGYTNFLWILELAAIWRVLGIRPEHVANWLSVIYTVGTIAVMLWWVARMPFLRHRGLIAWMALGLICSSATFAVWTSGGGLETRQFTFFALVAVACLSVFGANRWGLLVASLSLAAAALTRPEGLLVAACCVGWFVVQRRITVRTLDWRGTLALAGPFVILIGGHFLARFRYYGEWLPNTYYAKHVGSWYDSGFRYLWGAAIETGLYLLLPLAYVALRGRWRERRDGIYALVLLLVVTHMAYLFEIGGDHFEYRPLDYYWPLLAVPAAEGVARIAARLASKLHRRSRHLRWVGERALAVVCFVPLVFYSGAIQGVLLVEGVELLGPPKSEQQRVVLDEENSAWLLAAPGMPALVAISSALRFESARHSVALRQHEHRAFSDVRLLQFMPYDGIAEHVIPADAVVAVSGIGIYPYYVPHITVIDTNGLADYVVARNPVTQEAGYRVLAHERSSPSGYLRRRGVNFFLHPVTDTEDNALGFANYALKIGHRLWMPFNVVDHDWANRRFAGRDLRSVNSFSQDNPAGNRVSVDGIRYVGEKFIGQFEDGALDRWELDGKAVSNHAENPYFDETTPPVIGHVGPGYLTTYYPGKWEQTGRASSPTFTAREDQYLMFLIAGELDDHVGLRLLVDGEETAVWRGDGVWQFEMVIYPLREVAGKELQLEIFNNQIGDRPRLMLDHVMLVREEPPGSQ